MNILCQLYLLKKEDKWKALDIKASLRGETSAMDVEADSSPLVPCQNGLWLNLH